MAGFEIDYDLAGAPLEWLQHEVADRIGNVYLNDVADEVQGHSGSLVSGTLRVSSDLDLDGVQAKLDRLAADFQGNGAYLWAEAQER